MIALSVDLDALQAVCQRYGVARLEVFGSVARGTDTPQSDLDLLNTLAPGARLGWEIEDLTAELSAVLGRDVDLVSRRALHAALRDQVFQEAQLLYDAA